MCLGLTFMLLLLIASSKKGKGRAIKANAVNMGGAKFYLWLYRHLSKLPPTRRSVYHIRSRIEIVGHTNERVIRLKVAKLYLIVLLVMIGFFSIIVSMSQEPLMLVLWVFILWILSETLVDFFVIRLRNKLLWQQLKFNETVRHNYYQSKMVDEAIYETCMDLDKNHYEVSLQGERIYDILLSKDPEKEMMAYNEVAPNKYLKMFLSLCYMTMEYGDATIDGVSVFMKNLHDLTGEVRMELSKRERLNYALRSLNIIVLLPLLMISPIQSWSAKYFMPLQQFYDSQLGFILEIIMVFMILICYVLLRRVQQFDKQGARFSSKMAIEDKLYTSWLGKIIDLLKPKKVSPKYHLLQRQLKITRSNLSVEGFVIRQFLAFVGVLVVTVIVTLLLHYNTREQILTAPTISATFLGGQLSDEALDKANEITKGDTRYLSMIDKKTTLDEIQALLEENDIPSDQAMVIAKRIEGKQIELFNQNLKLWELALAFLLGLIGFQIPKLFLLFRRRLIKMEVEDEVTGFSTIILMLMHHERLAISDILEWFEMYAVTFTEPLGDCINNLTSGMTEALEGLGEASDNEQFIRIIEGLILASKDITIRQAFDELDTEKSYHLEKRKENNERLVEKKINMGNMIGFMPVYGLIVIYMIIPMILIGMKDMDQYFNQLNI